MEDRTVGINLIINGISFPLNVPLSEEAYYRQAGRLINETFSEYNKLFSEQGSLKVMTITALHIAMELVKKKDSIGNAEIMKKIGDLTALVDDTLSKE